MQTTKLITAILAAAALTLGAQTVQASTAVARRPVASRTSTSQATEKAEVRRVRGEVTAVEPSANPMTLTMKTKEGKEELTVGVDVTGKTIIREGKTRKTLSDIRVGDRVWMKYERTDGKLVADYVRILKPAHVAAKSPSSKESY